MRYEKYTKICFIGGGIALIAGLIFISVILTFSTDMKNTGCDTTERVFDNGNLLNSVEEEQLRQDIQKLSKKARTDLIVLTDDSALSDAE